ncbi:GTPase slip-gc [Fusarium sporotrichioides]|uniref:GTPase slip-gc n=1 Tax=Fusarium sporotrichioides TaxID=5514 RepID=A0A395RI93_FUSSP|nr:GTPase slip-gc [Fusarium sporotrichioides]
MKRKGSRAPPKPVKRERSPGLEDVPENPSPKRRADKTTGIVCVSTNFPWRECGETEDEERLKIKEKAVVRAETYCERIRTLLDSALNIPHDTPEAVMMGVRMMKHWCADHDQILKKHRKRQILVGVEGPTGAGKSSLLGSLLKIPELFPSGQESAATAVIGKVSWNWIDDPGREFRAQVIFRSRDQIANELEALLKELNIWSSLVADQADDEDDDDEDNDDDDDGERADAISVSRSEIEHQLPRVQAVWGLDGEQLLQLAKRCLLKISYSKAVDIIFNKNPTATKFLDDGKANFNASTAKMLSESIKPFLDSSSSTYGGTSQFAAWPLVRGVDLYVKADILKPGITLVDLPGCGDAVESRSEVAQKISHILDVRMVVSPIIRATDEKQGQALMQNGFDEAQMRIRGKMDGHGFCVIASKMDDMKVDSYVAGCPELAGDAEVIEKQSKLGELKAEKSTLKTTRSQLKEAKKEADTERKQATKAYEFAKTMCESHVQTDLKAAEAHLSDLRARLDEQVKVFTDVDERLDECELRQTQVATETKYIRDWIHHRAIQTRNARVIKRLRADFALRQKRMDNEKAPNHSQLDSEYLLPILPVSTRAFWQLESNDSPMPGFPDQTYTGIPAVEKWIHRATLVKREKHLDETLDGYQNLMTMMRIYSATKGQDGDFDFTRSEVEAALADTHNFYLKKLRSKLTEACSEIQKLDPLEHKDRAKRRFLREAQRIVQKWEYKYPDRENNIERMAFGTHAAIVRRMGTQYKSKRSGVTYTWIENLATPILKTLSRDWDRKMNKRLPLIRKPMMSGYSKVFNEYLKAIQRVIDEKVPLLAACFSNTRSVLKNSQRAIETRIGDVLETLAEDAAIVALDVVSTLQNEMNPTFEAALLEHGRGTFARRKEMIQSKMKADVTTICDEMIDNLVAGVAETIAEVPGQLEDVADAGPRNVQQQLSLLINNLVENHCTDPAVIAKKTYYQVNIRNQIDGWEAAWAEEGNYEEHILDLDLEIPDTIPEPVLGDGPLSKDEAMEDDSDDYDDED